MTGLEVVGAVAAVVSAFHGGAELVSILKKKHQKRKSKNQMQQEFEEKQLQDSLETGENAVGQRYSADLRELGDIVRVGDAIARERLLHIAIVMQAEVIKSLKLAITYDTAILNIKLLHEASILNRQDSIETLTQMKQRILISRPLPRTLVAGPDNSMDPRASFGSVQTIQTAQSAPLPAVPDEYVPQAVTLSAAGEDRDSKSGLAKYFSMKRNNSQSSTASSSHRSSTSSAASASFSPALNHLLQGKDRGAIMKDIDEIIASYQGLNVDNNKNERWALHGGAGGISRRDTLDILNGGDYSKRDTMGLNRDAQQLLRNLPATPEESHESLEYPAFDHNVFNQSAQSYSTPNPLLQRHMQTNQQMPSRWSVNSGASSVYSDTIPPSLYSNDSIGSFHPPTPPLVPDLQVQSSSASPTLSVMTPQHLRATSLPTVTTQQPQHNLPRPGFVTPQEPRSPIMEHEGERKGNRTQANLVPDFSPIDKPFQAPIPPNYHYRLDRPGPSTYMNQSPVDAINAIPAPGTPALNKTISISSSGGSTIRSNTIQGGSSPAQEKMMDGRPCKDNNYWGFCKGAWTVRESQKKGIYVQVRPVGMHTRLEVWQCRECHFEGKTFYITTPGKKKKELVVDPNVHVSAVGIRYKWMFLAKSHVKKKTMAGGAVIRGEEVKDDNNYGCLICSVEGNVTSIYGNVETLMNHIFQEHGRNMEDKTMLKSKCIVGRVARADEEWDLNIPNVAELMA